MTMAATGLKPAMPELDDADAAVAAVDAPGPADPRVDELAQIISAYNAVTERLQQSHETLQSEVIRLRRELASTNAQLQRSKRLSALGEMAAGIAHEIRNPLGAIQLYAGMVIEDLQPEASRPEMALDGARKIASCVRGLNAIVGDVLSFAREIEPQLQTVVSTDLFNRVVEAHVPAIDAAGVTIDRQDLDREPIAFRGDGNLLHQALLNLVRNAVEAAQAGDERRVVLDATCDGEDVTLTVADTGSGIPDDAIDRIFNPFFTTRNSGTGLGLAIVHRIIDAHGGAIAVHNDPQTGGAVFQLTLPAEDAVDDEEEADHER